MQAIQGGSSHLRVVTDLSQEKQLHEKKKQWVDSRVSIAVHRLFYSHTFVLEVVYSKPPIFLKEEIVYIRERAHQKSCLDFRESKEYKVLEQRYYRSPKYTAMLGNYKEFMSRDQRLEYVVQKITDCYFLEKDKQIQAIVYIYYMHSKTITEKELNDNCVNPKFADDLLDNTWKVKDRSVIGKWYEVIRCLFVQLDVELSDSSPILHGRSPDTVKLPERMLYFDTEEFLDCSRVSS